MITAQDIRDKTFGWARMNGYDMLDVDGFLEELAMDVSRSQKEIQDLKQKLAVYVGKDEEYREKEDAINRVLLSAEKQAAQIVNDALRRAAVIEKAGIQQKQMTKCPKCGFSMAGPFVSLSADIKTV